MSDTKKRFRIAVVDRETGVENVHEIENDDWLVITTGRCFVSHENRFRNGTAIITIKLEGR